MVFKIFLFLLVAYPCFGRDDSPVTFENLLSRLTPAQIQKIPQLTYLAELKEMQKKEIALGLELSQDIDYLTKFGPKFLPSQLYTMHQLERELGQGEIWLGLANQVFEKYGIKPQGIDDHEFLWWVYYDLAKAYYKGEGVAENPTKAFNILTTCAKHQGCKMLRDRLVYYLSSAEYLPDTGHLDKLWAYNSDDFRTMSQQQALDLIDAETSVDDDISVERPDDALFQACNNILDSTEKVLDAFRKQQRGLLDGGPVTQDQLQQAYQSIGAMNDIGGYQPVTFTFSSIHVNPVISLLWDVMAAEKYPDTMIKFADDLPEHTVEIRNKNVPAILVLAQLIEQFEMEVKCHENWVLFKPRSSSALNATKKLLISNFVTQYVYDENTKKAEIQWGEEFSYTGEVSGHMPNGEGILILFGDKISGQFEQGLLHGRGERVSSTGHITMKGEFKHGSLHGRGEYMATGAYLSDKAHFVGDFKQGLFDGQGTIHLRSDAYTMHGDGTQAQPNTIQYSGPITANEPHGTGQCRFKEMQYSCAFHKGYLIGFNGISLLPVIH